MMISPRLTEQDVERLMDAAIAAPSMHNTQPWRFVVQDDSVDVWLDPQRMLPAEDPSGRASHVSAGAAVFNVRVCAETLGLRARVEWRPDPVSWDLVARVRFESHFGGPDPILVRLADEVSRRHTMRSPMSSRRIPTRVLDVLEVACEREHSSLCTLTASARDQLMLLVGEADVLDSLDDHRLRERAEWVGGDREREGVPSSALGPRATSPMAPVRDLGVRAADRGRPVQKFEPHPTVAILSSRGDRPQDWLVTGMALQRLLLTLTRYGLVASFLNQPLERRELRRWVAELIRPAGHPQMILRIGYGIAGPHAPRRGTHEVVDNAPPTPVVDNAPPTPVVDNAPPTPHEEKS